MQPLKASTGRPPRNQRAGKHPPNETQDRRRKVCARRALLPCVALVIAGGLLTRGENHQRVGRTNGFTIVGLNLGYGGGGIVSTTPPRPSSLSDITAREPGGFDPIPLHLRQRLRDELLQGLVGAGDEVGLVGCNDDDVGLDLSPTERVIEVRSG